ncbi:MAG TPA: HYR domain-containing protein [Pyrinomonadaceae bacterium]|nr:HYR domain-containing protein [Pyrinomonadaceae bacterium]
MHKAVRWTLLFSLIAISFAVAWDFTPRSAGRNKGKVEVKTFGPAAKLQSDRQAALGAKTLNGLPPEANLGPVPEPTIAPEPAEGDDEDPDLPPGMGGRVDKEAYLRARGDYFDMLRGRDQEVPEGARERAIRQMEKQEKQISRTRSGNSALVNTTDWAFIGPNPIPLGQTSVTRVPVSGRTISIAVHPTDPDTVYVGTAQGGLYKSTNGGTNWTKLFEFQLETLAIGAVTIDPTDSSIVYVGTGENGQSADSFAGKGLYIIRNANSATPTLNGPFRLNGVGADVFSGRAIGRILVNPLNNNTIFVCTANGTGGNPNTTTVLQPNRGVYRSTNAQAATPTFEQIAITGVGGPDRSTLDIEMDPANPSLLLATVAGASSDGGIYRTANALDPAPTFTRTLAWANGLRGELTVTRSAAPATTFYAATGEQSTAGLGGPACGATQAGIVRRSTDGGLTWSAPGAMPAATGFCGGQCFYDIGIGVTPDNQTIHLAGAAGSSAANCGANVMKRSLNGGTNWANNNANLHADGHAVAIAPSNSQVVYTGSDGGIWRSTNNGTTWTSLNNIDYSATQFQGVAVHPFDRNFLMGGTQDNGTICWAANGTVSHCRDGDGGYAVIDDNAPDTFNVLMYHTFFNQTNNQIGFERASNTLANADGQLSGWTFRGCSGTVGNNGFRCADNVLFYAPMNQGPGSPVNTLYFGTDRLYRSTNRGDTMSLVSQGPLVPSAPAGSGVVVTSIGISPQDDNVRLVGMRDGHVFATTTGSAVLTNVTGGNFPAPNPIDLTRNSIGETVIDPNNKFTAYISFTSFSPPAGQQIFKTTNLNDPAPTWTPSSSGIPQVPVSSIAIDPQDSTSLYAGTDIGVYHSSDSGLNWTPLGTGLPRVAVFDVKISNVQRYLRIATHGRGIWEIGIPGRQLPVLRNGGATLTAEGCQPGNGVIDPGEDVTVSFGVTNIGPGPTNNLVVTLLPTGGVTFPSGPETYGVVASGATGFGSFHFSNNASCGNTITLTFHLQDGDLDLGNVSIPFTLGLLINSAPAFTENFDGVTAPALPAGWATARSGAGATPVLWVTTTATVDTAPNAAFGAGSTTPGESSLTSPVIAIPTAPVSGTNPGVRLTFRNNYNTEPTFDGGVLEISINGGPFTDVLAAGGTFIEGGYSGTIAVTDSVLTGRQAWTGGSGGFITTTVNLPPASYGQNAQLRWRTAYDTGTNPTGGGMRVDTISIYASTRVCCSGACALTCPANITVSNDPGVCGAVVTYAMPTETGNCGGVITSDHPSGETFPVGTTTVTLTDTRLDGSTATCTFTVTVNDTEFPVVSQPTNTPNILWPPNHQLVNVTNNYTATDNCPGLNCVLTVASNEPINGLGDGDTAPDWQVIDAHHVLLRAERSGKGNGRLYTITTTCTDASGNVTTKTSTVFVPPNQKAGPYTVFTAPNSFISPKVSGVPAALSATPTTNPLVMGMINFDFSSRPEPVRGSKVENKSENLVNFILGNLEFSSLNYDFRALAGVRTQFKGYGKLNNETGYKYLLTVIDGQAPKGGGVDKFRLKIWNDKTGEVVFDNQLGDDDDADPTTPVGDGKSITFPR